MAWNNWIRMVEIEPSVYAADFARLEEQIDVLLRTGARVFHWDVGDGHFVEPITMGPIVLKSIESQVHAMGGAIDVHLMVENPVRHFQQFAQAGADSITFHFEAVDDVGSTAAAAREHGLEVGVAFRPETDVAQVAAAAAEGVSIVTCMTVQPGYSGQEFIAGSLERISALRGLLPPEVHVQVDGGITNENVREIYDAGATLIVAASAIFQREDLPRAYRRLVQALA